MQSIKSHTDIEQSRKLAKILPLESADMKYKEYTSGLDYSSKHCNVPSIGHPFSKDIPCWSFVALLGVLPDYTLQTNTDGTVFVVCESKKPMISDAYANPVDACYEMILKLHELKML